MPPPATLYPNGSGPFVVYSYLLDIYRARKYDVNIHGKYIHRAKKIFQNIEILIQRIRLNLFKYDRFIEQLVGYSLFYFLCDALTYIRGYRSTKLEVENMIRGNLILRSHKKLSFQKIFQYFKIFSNISNFFPKFQKN